MSVSYSILFLMHAQDNEVLRLEAVRAGADAAAAEKARRDALHMAATQTAAAQVLGRSLADF